MGYTVAMVVLKATLPGTKLNSLMEREVVVADTGVDVRIAPLDPVPSPLDGGTSMMKNPGLPCAGSTVEIVVGAKTLPVV